jgi:hypothetical protein
MIKKLFLFLSLFYSLHGVAFTFSSATPLKFTIDDIPLHVAADNCSTIGYTPQQLMDVVIEAMDKYWSTVPTTRLRLIRGELKSFTVGSGTLTTFINSNAIANAIIIGCGSHTDDFKTGSGSGTLAIATSRTVGGVRAGAVVMGNVARVASNTRDEHMATLAHEIGHAFGLAHSLDDKALMYFQASAAKIQMDLTRDDADGITWLYPNEKKAGGCLGSFGTIDDISKKGPTSGSDKKVMEHFLLILVGILFGSTLVSFYRRKVLALF